MPDNPQQQPWEKYASQKTAPWTKYSTTQSDVTANVGNPEQPQTQSLGSFFSGMVGPFARALGYVGNPTTGGAMAAANPRQTAGDIKTLLDVAAPVAGTILGGPSPALRTAASGLLQFPASLVGNALVNAANQKNVPFEDQIADAAKSAGLTAGVQAGGEILGAGAAKLGTKFYQSALKPSTTLSVPERNAIVGTGLNEGVPVSGGGFDKLQKAIKDVNDKISTKVDIAAKSGKTVDGIEVARRINDVRSYFEDFPTPQKFLDQIDNLRDEFLNLHGGNIPVDKAQAMKKRTYQILKDAYGELQSSGVETSKAIARGLKEELVNEIPDLAKLNAHDSALLDLENELARATGRIGNWNLMKLGTAAGGALGYSTTGNPQSGKVWALMAQVLDNPNVKSRIGIALAKARSLGRIPLAAPIQAATDVNGQ